MLKVGSLSMMISYAPGPQFGDDTQRAPVNDTKWAILNQIVTKQRDPAMLANVYREMISIVESEGKDASRLRVERDKWHAEAIREGIRAIAKDMARMDSKWLVEIRTCDDVRVCDHCKKASKKKYRPDEFLASLPIPIGCLNPDGCRCWFGIIVLSG